MTPAYAVPGYVHAVTQSGGCWDQDLSSVQAETGEPEKIVLPRMLFEWKGNFVQMCWYGRRRVTTIYITCPVLDVLFNTGS